MVINAVKPDPVLDSDNSTAHTATTPPETLPDNLDWDNDFSTSSVASVPVPGLTFIIRSVSCGRVITLLDGQTVLTQRGGCGSIRWACVVTKNWLGFKNVASGKFLGHGMNGRLCCAAEKHSGWECFCLFPGREGGYVLFMTNYEDLWPVGIKVEQGVEYLAKIDKEGSEGIIWEFIEAPTTASLC
jgi:hypothetical protein